MADIEFLINLLSLSSATEALAVVTDVFPGQPVPERGQVVITELFEGNAGKDHAD